MTGRARVHEVLPSTIIRRAVERGQVTRPDGETLLTFVPDDPQRPPFRALLILNEDIVAPRQGFDMHPHRDAEILTYVVAGADEHQDDAGHTATLRAGDVQRVTAGTGIWHSELNPSDTETLRCFQAWLAPTHFGLPPSYSRGSFRVREAPNRLHLLASNDGRDGSVIVHADVDVFAVQMDRSASISHALGDERAAWVHVVDGEVEVNGHVLSTGDGIGLSGAATVELRAASDAHVLLFDLA